MSAPRNHAHQLTFRAWLVRQLQNLRWSSPDGESVADTARVLGVQIDVLEEAIRERAAANQRLGKPRRGLGKRTLNRSDYALVRVTMPPVIYRDWEMYCAQLQVDPAAILRSLLHRFLLSGQKPACLVLRWHYRGQVYPLASSGSRRVPTRITRGGQQVLEEYARLWGVQSPAIARGLVIDLLEGRTRSLQIVGYPELWGDPERYLRPASK